MSDPIIPLTSRRRLLINAVRIAGAAGAVGALAAATPAAAKFDPVKAGYQDTPKGPQRCDNCASWIAPDKCRIVDGKIAPQGWCKFYVKKT